MSILVKPFNRKTGNYAPSMISFLDQEEGAINDVKYRSALSKFSDWDFSRTKKLTDKKVKSKFNKEDE